MGFIDIETAHVARAQALPRLRRWEVQYGKAITYTDALLITVAVYGAQFFRFGTESLTSLVSAPGRPEFVLPYTVLSAAIILLWIAALGAGDSRDPKIFGVGASEYKRVANSSLFVFGALAIAAYFTKTDIGRAYLIVAAPTGLALVLVSRWMWRKWLHARRRSGRSKYQTLIVGEAQKARHVAREITRSTYAGFELVGAVSEDPARSGSLLPGVPFVGGYEDIIESIDDFGIDTVILIGSDSLLPEQLRELGWQLETRHVDMIVAAALTDVAGPRIHMRPVANLPLVHVDFPRFVGRKHFAKRLFDLLASAFLIVVLAPIMLGVGIAVAVTSPGPVFFPQERVGLGGKRFRMLKFRSMVTGADAMREGLEEQSDGNGVLFKLKNDPRVTRVGAVLRKYSLDELPQLFNVFGGSMSLVGPRPPLQREVDEYLEWDHRRLLVKPGITGLWQVSGRSDLSWEDSIRLDLFYVENWSLVGDLLILARTVKTVATSEGAY